MINVDNPIAAKPLRVRDRMHPWAKKPFDEEEYTLFILAGRVYDQVEYPIDKIEIGDMFRYSDGRLYRFTGPNSNGTVWERLR